LLNPEPLGDPNFTDTKFKYAVPYIYTVRALSQGSTGLIESADSTPVPHTPVDTFKPSAPDPVSIASANSVISLFWPTSPEHDVVGYIVYRSESLNAQPQDWTRLTPEPMTTVTYRDERVRLGRRYYYRVTAIDGFKNESESSTIVSEVANP
jgi:fibronectin type 3 domain-containing protein